MVAVTVVRSNHPDPGKENYAARHCHCHGEATASPPTAPPSLFPHSHEHPIQAHGAVVLVDVGEEFHVQGIHVAAVGGGAGID